MAKAKREPLPVNPNVLIWARTRAGYSAEDAASKIQVMPARIRAWESGENSPTPRQARQLAKLYNRPFLEFFAQSVPELPDVELVPDFRLFAKGPTGEEARELRIIQEWAEEQRTNALSLIEDLGDHPPILSRNLRFSVTDSQDEAAQAAREAMRFSRQDQIDLRSSDRFQVPNTLRDRIEGMGVLVLKQNRLTKLRTRGVCLYAEPLPVVIFGGEAPSAQSFTLAHEFGHGLHICNWLKNGAQNTEVIFQSTTAEERTLLA